MTKKMNRQIYFLMLLTIIISIVAFFKSSSINGNDFWWHIKAGEWMVTNHKIPTHDMFSWLNQIYDLKWTAHEWLSELAYYAIHHFFGTAGIMIFCIVAAAALISVIAMHLKETMFNNFLATCIYFFHLAVLCVMFFFGRPHVFSYFLLFYLIKAVYDYVSDKSKKSLYFVPVIAVLWANFHGGSSNITYVIPILAIITGLFNFKMGKLVFTRLPKNKIINLILIIPVTMLGICINPYGFHMLKYPYENMADSAMLNLISEWASPDAKILSLLLFFFLPFAFGLLVYIITKEEISAFDLIIYAFFSYLFLRSGRFIVFLVIAAPFCVFKYIPKFGTLEPVKTKAEKLMAITITTVFVCYGCFNIYNGIQTAKDGKLITHVIEDEFVQLIKDDAPQRPFTDYNYGGDLIYNGVTVFVDGRADVYTGKPLEDASSLMYVNPLYTANEDLTPDYIDNLLDEYNFDAFLLPSYRPLALYLASHPEKYELIKRSDDTVYYKVKTNN